MGQMIPTTVSGATKKLNGDEKCKKALFCHYTQIKLSAKRRVNEFICLLYFKPDFKKNYVF